MGLGWGTWGRAPAPSCGNEQLHLCQAHKEHPARLIQAPRLGEWDPQAGRPRQRGLCCSRATASENRGPPLPPMPRPPPPTCFILDCRWGTSMSG